MATNEGNICQGGSVCPCVRCEIKRLRAENVSLREKALTKEKQRLAREQSSQALADNLAMVAQIVQARSEQKEILLKRIAANGGGIPVEVRYVWPLGHNLPKRGNPGPRLFRRTS